MLIDFILMGKHSGFKSYPLFLATTFCLLFSGYHAEAANSSDDASDILQSSFQSSCKRDDCDSDHKNREKDSHIKRACCPGPKGPRGERGPEGNPACPGIYTDFASYQLILAAGQNPVEVGAGAIIPFGRQTVLRGHSISSFPPFHTFEVEAGVYEVSVGISNQGTTANPANGLVLVVGSKTYTFPVGDVFDDIITYRKVFQAFLPTDISVKTSNATGITFTPPDAGPGPGDNAGIAAYINIVRVH